MTRRLLNLLTLLSMLLCVAVAVLWVRSQFVSDYIAYDGPVDPGLYARCWISLSTGQVTTALDRRYTDSPQERETTAAALSHPGNPRVGPPFWRTASPYTVTAAPYADAYWPQRFRWNFALPRLDVFRLARPNLPGGGGVTEIRRGAELPFWCLALAFALPPLRWDLRRRRANRRTRLGLCRRCGYDLKDNQSGVCPECGMSASTMQ
jgi:hypothetical protein